MADKTKHEGKTVWIDIDNSPHVPFFLPIIEELEKEGFKLLLTARDMYQVCDLLDFFQLRSRVKVIGGHGGKNKILKVVVNCVRAGQLLPLIAKNRPQLAVSHGSRAQVLVSKLLGIPSVMMHDYEHSTKTGFLEAEWTITPDIIPSTAMSHHGSRTLKYPGLKEDVYVPRFKADPSLLSELKIAEDDLLITLRPPATEAHYHNPEAELLFAATLRRIAGMSKVRAVTLPRNSRQGAQLRAEYSALIASGHMIIPDRPVDGLNLIWFSDLVISGGGTMNREAAALNVPVYSIFRGKIGAVDRYLSETGRLIMLESVEDVDTKIQMTRRDKSSQVAGSRPETLKSIIQSIISIGEAECPSTQKS
ncbi:MAG TPA: DUF354 domain-containing protein [Candidatus Acidoferrum sp.]|nr:DUF354 domain-containing protein [Candidatus Acidoferrum sp.]